MERQEMWDDAGDALRAVESLHGVPDDWALDDWGFDEGGAPEGVASDGGDGRQGGDRGPELTASGGSRE